MSAAGKLFKGCALFIALGVVVLIVFAVAARMMSGGIPLGADRIAVVRVEGMITDSSHEVELVRQYREDPHVKAIVVRVETGGGAVGSSQELYEELLRTDAEKPVFVSFGNVAASGGYYVALGGRRIFANPGTLTGSIGVLFTHVDASRLLDETLRVHVSDVVSGANKDLGAPWEPLSEDDRAMLGGLIANVRDQFVGAVRIRRGEAIRRALATANGASREVTTVTDAEIDAHLARLCDGRPFTGEEAVAWGFVDQIGTLQEAIDAAAKSVGIEGPPHVTEWKPRRGLLGAVVHGFVGDVSAAVRQEFAVQSPLRYELRMP